MVCSCLYPRDMSVLLALSTAVSLVLLSGTGRLVQAEVELRIILVARKINAINPTGQNNIVTLACNSENTMLSGSSRPVLNPRYFTRDPLTSRERVLDEFSVEDDGRITFTITPELEGVFTCDDADGSPSVRSQVLELTGESERERERELFM